MYNIEVLVWEVIDGQHKQVWRKVHPSFSEVPYAYGTEREAEDIMEICYPETDRNSVRVATA